MTVDGVHAVPHFLVDRAELGADVLLCSAYEFFGAHMGIASIHPGVFARLKPYKVGPAPAG